MAVECQAVHAGRCPTPQWEQTAGSHALAAALTATFAARRRGAAGIGRWHRQWGCEIDETNRTRVELMTGCIAATAPKVRATATPVESNRR
jgi:hypothetical protein